MKSLKTKLIVLATILAILITIMQIVVLAKEKVENVVVKKADEEFIIYYKEICNSEFQFAFSNSDTTAKGDLNFINSAKDSADVDSLNVVYIDSILYNKYFTAGDVYVWIKNGDNYLVESQIIDLKESINNDTINQVNNITKNIAIDATQTHQTNAVINGIDTTVTTGKLVINKNTGSKYYYQIKKASNEYNNLFELANKIKATDASRYTNLYNIKEFSNLYNKLEPQITDTNWVSVDDDEILQPEDSKDGEKYIVWLKEEKSGKSVIDAQFLTSSYSYENKKETEQVTVKETVNLPVTYDSIALFVVLGILILAIAVVLVLKHKNKKENK